MSSRTPRFNYRLYYPSAGVHLIPFTVILMTCTWRKNSFYPYMTYTIYSLHNYWFYAKQLTYTYVQWTLTYPDTSRSVPNLTVRITEYLDKWVTFSILYIIILVPKNVSGKWLIWISGVRISEASLYSIL